MAQSLGRRLKRGNAIAYYDGMGKISILNKTHHWRCTIVDSNVIKNKIEPQSMGCCNLKPATKIS